MPALRGEMGMWRGKLSGRVPVSHQDALHEVLGSRTGKSCVFTGSQRMSINWKTVAYQREKQTYFWSAVRTLRRLIRSTQGGDPWPTSSLNPVSEPKIPLV